MDHAPQIARLEELAIAFDEELHRLADSLPGLKTELQGALAARVAELATANRADGREAVREQCAAMRVELGAIAERHFAAVMAERQKIVGLGELTHTLTAFATKAAQQVMREYAAQANGSMSDVVKRELAAYQPLTPAPLVPNFADVFCGNFDSDVEYQRGDIFAFRGGCYLVLKPSRGVLPTQQEQKGTDPRYALLASPGAPGRPGLDLTVSELATLTDATTVAWNLSSPVAQVTIAGSRTLTVSNLLGGATYILHVIQGGSGSNTMTWPSNVKWPGDTAPVLTTTAGKRDIFTFTAAGLSGTTYLFGAYVQNYPL